MAVLRTPEERFDSLPGYRFEPHYLTVEHPRQGAVRLHYLDEGPKDAPVALLLHGEPTWSFLYRKVIPIVTAAGFRTVARTTRASAGPTSCPTARTRPMAGSLPRCAPSLNNSI